MHQLHQGIVYTIALIGLSYCPVTARWSHLWVYVGFIWALLTCWRWPWVYFPSHPLFQLATSLRWVLEHAAVPYPFGVSRVWFVKSGKFEGLVGIYATHVLLGFVVSLPFHSPPLPLGPNRRCPFDWLRVSKTAHIKIKILF